MKKVKQQEQKAPVSIVSIRKFMFGCIGMGLITTMAFADKVSGEVATQNITHLTLGVMVGYVGEYFLKGRK